MTTAEIKNKIIKVCPGLKEYCGFASNFGIENPIQLHHVLRAIERTKNYDRYCLSCDGTFYRSNPGLHHKEITWNLSKDFDGQEDAVKTFCKKCGMYMKPLGNKCEFCGELLNP